MDDAWTTNSYNRLGHNWNHFEKPASLVLVLFCVCGFVECCWSRCVYLKHCGSVQPTTRNEFPSSLFNLTHRCFTYCPCCLATSQPQWKNLCAFFPLSGGGDKRKWERGSKRLYTHPLHSLPTKHGVPEVNKKCLECWKPEECQKLIHTLNVVIFNDVIKYLTL